MENFTNKIKDFANNSNKNAITKLILILIFITIIIVVSLYINHKLKLGGPDGINCSNLNKIYPDPSLTHPLPSLNSVINSPNKKYLLRDFYVKTAYNCCCGGQFKNDFVNLCALTKCIQQGARCLDFEIYSINNQPVVAASSIDDFTVKETYNSINIADVFDKINELAFSNSKAPAYQDPLILHFRIMSNNIPMYKVLADTINTKFNNRLLDSDYSDEYHGKNLGSVSMSDLANKIIIIVDATNPIYKKTPLKEDVNIASGSPFMHILKYQNVKFTQDIDLTDFNKKNMSIVIPGPRANDTNPNFNIARQYGCQFLAMSFQNYDSNLEHYNTFFDSQKFAFVLKPDNLRYIPVTIPLPPPPPQKYSYEKRPIQSDYYNYSI